MSWLEQSNTETYKIAESENLHDQVKTENFCLLTDVLTKILFDSHFYLQVH